MARVLLVDNYDSFTYNLVQYLGELGAEVTVVKNDEITPEQVGPYRPDGVLLSPGPCDPDKAGVTLGVLDHWRGKLPIFGVCLGHQAIGQAFGGKVVRAKKLMHGRVSDIHHDGLGVFANLPNPFVATRYHSLAVERASLPGSLTVSAWTDDGEIMGLRSESTRVEGVQFHPESILTTHGMALLRNWTTSLAPR